MTYMMLLHVSAVNRPAVYATVVSVTPVYVTAVSKAAFYFPH